MFDLMIIFDGLKVHHIIITTLRLLCAAKKRLAAMLCSIQIEFNSLLGINILILSFSLEE